MTIALLSIRPNYVNQILSGQKTVEFRRTKFKRDVSHILVYASVPVKRLVGYFKVADIYEMSPEQAWRDFMLVGGIDRQAFFDYYKGAKFAYVISIAQVTKFENEVLLTEVCKDLSAPQSYRYLPKELFDKAKGMSVSCRFDC